MGGEMKLLSVLLAFNSLATPVSGFEYAATEVLKADLKGEVSPGCIAGAFRTGKTLLVAGAGVSDMGSPRPLNADTMFNTASMAKQFTALAAAKLVEERGISLDDDIRKYLPEIKRYDAPVTVRMLMNHTSGIRDVWTLHLLAGASNPAGVTKQAALDMLFRQKDTNFTPGSAYAYSNGGFLLLAEIIERASGMSLADYAKRKIFDPLRMRRTLFRDGRPFAAENAAAPHVRTKEGFVVRDDYPSFSGPGGLITSINDLAKFEQDISGGNKVWTPTVRRIMDVPGTLTNGEQAFTGQSGFAYGSGRMMGRRKGQYFVQHGGGGTGFQSIYARLPERKLAVAVLCNRGDVEPEEKADKIIELIEGDILINEKRTIEQLSGIYFSEELEATYQVAVSPEQLELTVSSSSAKGPGPRLTLKRSGDKTFASSSVRLVFHEDNRGFSIAADRVRAVDFRARN